MRSGVRVDSIVACIVLMARFANAYNICYQDLCTGWSSRKPSLKCPPNTLILITNVICRGRKECQTGIHANALNVCSGRRTCTLNNELYTSMCGEHNERRVSIAYTCAINTSKNIERSCGPKRLSHAYGFIQSPGYPSAFRDDTTCWWYIAIEYNQQVYIRVYEMQSLQNAAARNNATVDLLRVTPQNILPQCEYSAEQVVDFGTTSRIRSMVVRCHSNVEIMLQHNSGKGVRMWLFYQVLPKGDNPLAGMPSSLTERCITDRDDSGMTGPRARIAVVTRHDRTNPLVTDSGMSTTTTVMVDGVTVPMTTVDGNTVLLISIPVCAVLVIVIVIIVAVICVKRNKKMLEAAYKEGALADGRKSSATPVTTCYEDIMDIDSTGTGTYETIDSIMAPRLSDTYYHVADEMPFPPPRPRLSDDSEYSDNASAAYAEVHSQHYGSPSRYLDYREQMKERVRNKQLSECETIPESESNIYSDPNTNNIITTEVKKTKLQQPYFTTDIVNVDKPSYGVIEKRFNPQRLDSKVYETIPPS